MKFTDYKSPEKAIINTTFKSIPYMDMWILSIIEGYIYEKVVHINDFLEYIDEEYTERYGKREGECKVWYSYGQLMCQCYYKKGKKEGEYKDWYSNGQLMCQCYYKKGKIKGVIKQWNKQGELLYQIYYKE